MPLFKLPFEENFPIRIPFAGQPQPFGAGPAGGNGAGAGWLAIVGAAPAGRRITVVLLEEDALEADFVTTAVGAEPERPSKRMVCPGEWCTARQYCCARPGPCNPSHNGRRSRTGCRRDEPCIAPWSPSGAAVPHWCDRRPGRCSIYCSNTRPTENSRQGQSPVAESLLYPYAAQ